MLADKLVTDVSNYVLEIQNLKTEGKILRVKTILSGKELKKEYGFLESLDISAEPSAATAFCGIKNIEFTKDDILVIICSGKGNFNPEVLDMEGQLGNLGTGTDTLLEYSAFVEKDPEKAKVIRGRELLNSVEIGDQKKFNFLMAMQKSNRGSVSLEERDSGGNTPLCLAAAKGADEFTAKLLEAGARVSAKNRDDETPLILACLQKNQKETREMDLPDLAWSRMQEDVEGGENTWKEEEMEGNYSNVVYRLLENGADIFQRDGEGRGVLLAAIESEDTRTISMILNKSRELCEEELNEIEEVGKLEKLENEMEKRWKEAKTETEMFDALCGQIDLDVRSSVTSGRRELWKKIKDKYLRLFENQSGTSPLARAIEKDERELAEDLIEWIIFLEGNPFEMQKNGWSVLIPAMAKGEEDTLFLLKKIMQYTKDMKQCSPINERYRGYTPLHLIARMKGKKTKDLIQLIVRFEEDMEKEDIFGKLPLELAIISRNDEAAALLVNLGKKKHEEKMERNNEAIKASNRGDMDRLEKLMGKMDTIGIPKSVNSRLLFKILKRAKEDQRRIYLIYECVKNFHENIEAETGETSFAGGLHSLVELNDDYDWDYQEIVNCTSSPPYILKKMIELGVNLEETDSEGRTALLYAIEARLEKAAIMLVKGGAKTDSGTGRGETALELAEKWGMEDLKDWLEDPKGMEKMEEKLKERFGSGKQEKKFSDEEREFIKREFIKKIRK
ncbi:hypothetical protein GF415_03485 [Candidatus Micrarchaeota archaeon]|nr:hypothetical protein [Candidatus Micrarchaeota archaeon]